MIHSKPMIYSGAKLQSGFCYDFVWKKFITGDEIDNITGNIVTKIFFLRLVYWIIA